MISIRRHIKYPPVERVERSKASIHITAHWTEADSVALKALLEIVPPLPLAEMARRLGRNRKTVKVRIVRLGIMRP